MYAYPLDHCIKGILEPKTLWKKEAFQSKANRPLSSRFQVGGLCFVSSKLNRFEHFWSVEGQGSHMGRGLESGGGGSSCDLWLTNDITGRGHMGASL